MGLFDKVKETAQKAKQAAVTAGDKAMEAVGSAKAAYDQKKVEQALHNAEMSALCAARSQEIVDAILEYRNDGDFFRNTNRDELLAFTKDFYDKVLLPAKSVTSSKLEMYPYIVEKKLQKFAGGFDQFDAGEVTLFYLCAEGKQEIVMTDKAMYFSLALAEDPKFYVRGRIPMEEVSVFSTEKAESAYLLKCDEFVLASFSADKSTAEDFVSLNNYFQCIINHDFVITDEEVDQLIREKITDKIYNEVKKYFVFDDELMVYFAWGLDSLSAKDYIVCTNKQILIMDREMFGSTANVKQFYYEDITSASTEQNSKSSDFTSALLDSAITAATKTCSLVLSVAGATTRIDTLYKIEAERVVAVYHQFRKAARAAAAQPQVVVQQAPAEDPLAQIQKLFQLKEAGIISEEEFNQKKSELLAKV